MTGINCCSVHVLEGRREGRRVDFTETGILKGGRMWQTCEPAHHPLPPCQVHAWPTSQSLCDRSGRAAESQPVAARGTAGILSMLNTFPRTVSMFPPLPGLDACVPDPQRQAGFEVKGTRVCSAGRRRSSTGDQMCLQGSDPSRGALTGAW